MLGYVGLTRVSTINSQGTHVAVPRFESWAPTWRLAVGEMGFILLQHGGGLAQPEGFGLGVGRELLGERASVVKLQSQNGRLGSSIAGSG